MYTCTVYSLVYMFTGMVVYIHHCMVVLVRTVQYNQDDQLLKVEAVDHPGSHSNYPVVYQLSDKMNQAGTVTGWFSYLRRYLIRISIKFCKISGLEKRVNF